MNRELKDDLLPSAGIAAMKCYAPFPKRFFKECIGKVKQQMKYDVECSHNLKKVFPDAFQGNLLYDNSAVIDQIIKMLKVLFKDTNDWIDYFIYELDFGKKNEYLKVTEKDGTNVPLRNATHLYDLLLKNMEGAEIEKDVGGAYCGVPYGHLDEDPELDI